MRTDHRTIDPLSVHNPVYGRALSCVKKFANQFVNLKVRISDQEAFLDLDWDRIKRLGTFFFTRLDWSSQVVIEIAWTRLIFTGVHGCRKPPAVRWCSGPSTPERCLHGGVKATVKAAESCTRAELMGRRRRRHHGPSRANMGRHLHEIRVLLSCDLIPKVFTLSR